MTLLRLVRALPLPKGASPRILGVDDWARKRGRTYGTILVDQERHTVIDLLPERTAKRSPPGCRIIPAWRSSVAIELTPTPMALARVRLGRFRLRTAGICW